MTLSNQIGHTVEPSARPVVLLVDDHPLVPMALSDLIEQRFSGVRCLRASSIRQARGIYGDESDLLVTVLDVHLPDATGLNGLIELRALRPEVPVVVFTGTDSESMRRSAIALGASALVSKHEQATSLVEVLVRFVSTTLPNTRLLHREPAADPLVDGLSTRQQQIWQALAEGLSNIEISERYQISLNTTKAHVSELLQRLGARNRTEAATRFYRNRPTRFE